MDLQTPLIPNPEFQEPVDPPVAEVAGTPPPPQKKDSFIMSFISPKRDIIKFLPVFLVLFLVAALPLAVFLVKQREAPTKAEVSPGVVTDKCGHVTLGPVNENYSSQNSTYTLSVPVKNNRSEAIKVKLHWETNYCRDGNQQNCDQNEQVFDEEVDFSPNENKILQKSVKQELGDDCGSLQIDVGVISVNGDTSCTTIGQWKTAVWGVHKTGKNCVDAPTSPPGNHPDCSNLGGPGSAVPGETISFTAHPSGNNLKRVEFWLISEEDVKKHGLCPPSEWAPKVWTKIIDDNNGNDGWSAQWNTTGYAIGRYFIAANVYSVYGDENWWCTGNPEGPCNQDSKGKSCPACSKWVTLTTQVPTSTPTPSLSPTPSPTPEPTAPPTYTCLCNKVIADRSLGDLSIGDVIKFIGFGKTNHPQAIGKIKFIISKDRTVVKAQEVLASLDREESGWRFYRADSSYTVEDYGDYEVAIQVDCLGKWQD